MGQDSNTVLRPLLVDASGRPLIVANGQEAGGTVTPILVDASGHVQADVLTLPAIPAGTNEIGAVQARKYGYVGGAWQKDPVSIGYSGQVLQFKSAVAVAGTNTLDSDAVAASTIWVITNLVMRYTGTITNVTLFMNIYDGVTSYLVWSQSTITSGVDYTKQGYWVLKAADKLRFTATNGTAGDAIRLYATGFYTSLAA